MLVFGTLAGSWLIVGDRPTQDEVHDRHCIYSDT